MPKSSQYWKEYNQKRKSYLTQKKREARKRARMSTTHPETLKVVDRVVDTNRNEVVDILAVVDRSKVVDRPVVDNLTLTHLIKEWQTQTNYNCVSTCAYSYCSNCWYFHDNQLINYKRIESG
jgi:hypothetical protein